MVTKSAKRLAVGLIILVTLTTNKPAKRGRDRKAFAFIGGRAQGKSTLIKKLLDSFYSKAQKDKVLILTPTVPPAYEKVKEVDLEFLQTKNWYGMVRYYNHDDAKQMLKDVHHLCIQGKLRKGCIVFEDCTNYIDPWPAESIRNFLVNMRMFDLDLIFTTHALRFLPKFCRGMVNYITVFKTAETFENPKELRQLAYPNYHHLYIGWQEVMHTQRDESSFVQAYRTVDTGL